MAINSFHQYVLHNGRSRRISLISLGILIGSLAWASIADSAWASDLTPSLDDHQVQTIASVSETDSASTTTLESADSSNAAWRIEIAYAVSETSSGVSQE